MTETDETPALEMKIIDDTFVVRALPDGPWRNKIEEALDDLDAEDER